MNKNGRTLSYASGKSLRDHYSCSTGSVDSLYDVKLGFLSSATKYYPKKPSCKPCVKKYHFFA